MRKSRADHHAAPHPANPVRHDGSGHGAGSVAGRTDGPGSAAGDGSDDLVFLGFRIEGAAVEDVHAVDLL